VYNIHSPSLTVSLPAKGNGAAAIVCPGGAHRYLAVDIEGFDVAKWLNEIGVTAFILKSRLSATEGTPYTIQHSIQDAQQALRVVRSRAAEWKVDPSRVGLMGFSAGAHLSLLAATSPAGSARPDFLVLVYPGGVRPESTVIPENTPQTLLLSAADDKMATQANLWLYPALLKAGVPAELHIYDRGGHGFGIRGRSPEFKTWSVSHWPEHVAQWMTARGITRSRP
jgi:acetyl esterase/lipase